MSQAAMMEAPQARPKSATIRDMLVKHQGELVKALPKHVTADRLIRVAMTTVNGNYRLLDCSQESLLKCIVTCAQLGLVPDPATGEAYLVPFNLKSGGYVSQLIVGYKGMLKLARQSGEITAIDVRPVFARDKFEVSYGLHPDIVHVPYEGADRGEFRAVYAVAHFRQEGVIQWDVMWKHEVDEIRKRSRAAHDGPWVTDYVAMAEKTMIRHLMKMLPQSTEIVKALDIEDRFERGEPQFEDAIDVSFVGETREPKAIDRLKEKVADDRRARAAKNGPGKEAAVVEDEDPEANDVANAFTSRLGKDESETEEAAAKPVATKGNGSRPSAAEKVARERAREEVKRDMDAQKKKKPPAENGAAGLPAKVEGAVGAAVAEEADADKPPWKEEDYDESEPPAEEATEEAVAAEPEDETNTEPELVTEEQLDLMKSIWKAKRFSPGTIEKHLAHYKKEFRIKSFEEMTFKMANEYIEAIEGLE